MLGEVRHNPLVGQNWEAKIGSWVVPMLSSHALGNKGTDLPPASIITVCSSYLLVALLSALWSAPLILISLDISPRLGRPQYPYISRFYRYSVGDLELRDHDIDLGMLAMMGQVQKEEAKQKRDTPWPLRRETSLVPFPLISSSIPKRPTLLLLS